jgi:hypothetical protein
MNAIKLTSTTVTVGSGLGVAIEGSTAGMARRKRLMRFSPRLDALNQQKYFVDVFKQRSDALRVFLPQASDPWIVLSATKERSRRKDRVWLSIDWSKAPKGEARGTVKIARGGKCK